MAGCVAERLRREGNVFHVPNDQKAMIPEIVERWEDFVASLRRTAPASDYALPVRASTTRANLKIPGRLRQLLLLLHRAPGAGAPRSKPRDLVLDECERIVAAGFREIVLTGVRSAITPAREAATEASSPISPGPSWTFRGASAFTSPPSCRSS